MTTIIEFDGKIAVENCVDKIIHGDCLEIMRLLPEKCVDVVITSPPYNLLNSSGNGLKKNTNCGKWKNAAIKNGYAEYDDNMPYAEYIAWQRECVAEMCRIIKDDGAVFYNNKNRVQNGLLEDRGEILRGFPLRQVIIWKRSGAINFNQGYFLPTTEQIYLLCNKAFKLAKGANKLTDVWEIKQEMKNPHPAYRQNYFEYDRKNYPRPVRRLRNHSRFRQKVRQELYFDRKIAKILRNGAGKD